MRHTFLTAIGLSIFSLCLVTTAFAQPAPPPEGVDGGTGTAEAPTPNPQPQMCPVTPAQLDACKAETAACESDVNVLLEKDCDLSDDAVRKIYENHGYTINDPPSDDGQVECEHAQTHVKMRGKDKNKNGLCDGTGKRKKRKPAPPTTDAPPPDKGTQGAIVAREDTLEEGHKKCPYGGTMTSFGRDEDGDDALGNEESTLFSLTACNGAPGKDGVDGEDGEDGVDGKDGEDGAGGSGTSYELGFSYRLLYLQAFANDGRPDGLMFAPEYTFAIRNIKDDFGLMVGFTATKGRDGAKIARALALYRIQERVTLRGGFEGQYWDTNAPPGAQSGTAQWETMLVSGGVELTIVRTDHLRLACDADLSVGYDGYDEQSKPAMGFAGNCGAAYVH